MSHGARRMKTWPLTAPARCGHNDHNGASKPEERCGWGPRAEDPSRPLPPRGSQGAHDRRHRPGGAGGRAAAHFDIGGRERRRAHAARCAWPSDPARQGLTCAAPRYSRQWPSGVRGYRRRTRRSRVIVYVDASALAKRYVDEAGSSTVRAVIAREVIATSRLSEIEIASGLVRRFREAGISSRNLERTLSSLREDVRSIAIVEIDEEITREAVSLLARHRLRASDAVQLASCLQVRRLVSVEVRLLAYDHRLNDAATVEGLAVVE